MVKILVLYLKLAGIQIQVIIQIYPQRSDFGHPILMEEHQ